MQSTAQQEALRQQYLQAIGITTWLPTQAMPGAANRVQWRWQSADAAASAETGPTVSEEQAVTAAASHQVGNTATTASRPVSRAQDVLAQMRGETEASRPTPATADAEARQETDARATPAATASAGQAPATAAPVPAAQNDIKAPAQSSASLPPPRFRLLLAAYADCLVACDMPQQRPQAQSADADRHYHLLAAILQSIGLGQGEAHFHQFDWPFINSDHIDQGPEVARQGLADVMGRMPAAADVPLLLFGVQAAEYVLPVGAQVAEAPWQQDARWCLAAPSLHELMGVPGLKRELWQQLQYLQRHLGDGRG